MKANLHLMCQHSLPEGEEPMQVTDTIQEQRKRDCSTSSIEVTKPHSTITRVWTITPFRGRAL